MKIFKNKLFLVSTLILIMLLNLTLVAFADNNSFSIDINAQTSIVTITGATGSDTDVNIIIQNSKKRYYIDTVVSDSDGNYIFKTELPENTTLECRVTIGSITKTKQIVMPQKTDGSGGDETPSKKTVTISIDKFTIGKGYVLTNTQVELLQGDSVWDVLKRVLNKNNIDCEYEYNSKYNSIYVESIDGDGEFDHGHGSGWMYSVNEVYPDIGCSVYILQNNDVIKWRYTTNLGKDIGGGSALGDDEAKQVDSSINIKSKRKGDKSVVIIDDKLINKTVKSAKSNRQSIITINVKDTIKTDQLELNMTTSQINKIKELDDAELSIKSNLMEICIPKLVLKDLSSKKNSNFVICIKKENQNCKSVDNNKKTVYKNIYEKYKDTYNVSLLIDNKVVKELSDKIVIKIPYVLKDDKNKKNVVVYSLNSNGRPLEIIGSRYNDAYDCAVFKTNSFKDFVVGIKDEYESHKDIVEEEWYYTSVKYAVENKLFDGMPDGNFNPSKEMTRSMLVTVLYRLEGEPEVNDESNFSDVEKGEWYERAVLWAKNNNITAGYGNGEFGIKDNVTREQLATMLFRYAKLKGLNIENEQLLTEFNDSELISLHHVDSVKWAVKNNIIGGKPGSLLAPDSNASRAQVAKIIMNYIINIYR